MEHEMELDDSGDSLTTITHEYPDPEDVPQYPWVGNVETRSLAQGSDILIHDTTPLQNELTTQKSYRERLGLDGMRWSGQASSADSDYEYREDSAKSDEYMSEAESDLHVYDELSHTLNDRSLGRGRRRQRGASRGSRGGKGIKRGPRKPLEPSPEFKQLHSQATLAYIEQNYELAEERVQQAIRTNPEMFQAHSLLSEIHLARGDKDKALIALFHGAHTRPRDAEVWMTVAQLLLDRAGDERVSGVRDAIYCYNRIIEIDVTNTEARHHRATLNLELGYAHKAAYDYDKLLILCPHDTTVLRHIAEVCIEADDVNRAIDLYNTSITYYQNIEPSKVKSFSWSDANSYAELFLHSTRLTEGIACIKSVSRWLLDRGDDQFWDHHAGDDREFDLDDCTRRSDVAEFVPGKYDRWKYGEGLPLELRIKLGILRLKLADNIFEEAMNHFIWLEPDNLQVEGKLFEYPDLFEDVAITLLAQEKHHEALRFFEPLLCVREHMMLPCLQGMATCYRVLKQYDEAEDCYLAISHYEGAHRSALIQLAKMFEDASMLDRASPYISEIIEIDRQDMMNPKSDQSALSPSMKQPQTQVLGSRVIPSMLEPLAPSKPSKKTIKDVREMTRYEDLRVTFLRMQILKPQVDIGNEASKQEWMRLAKILIEDFKKRKLFFPQDKSVKFFGYTKGTKFHTIKLKAAQAGERVDTLAEKLQHSANYIEDDSAIPYTYSGISFQEWLDVFLEYAFFHAQDSDVRSAYKILGVATDANVFYNSKDYMFLIHVCWFTCALIVDDSDTVCNVSRYFMKEYQFVADGYRLFTVLNRLCNGIKPSFNASSSQKFILRQVKAMDYSFIPQDQQKSIYQEKASFTAKDELGNRVKAESMDIGLLMLYGHILYAGTSYSYALSYYFRAYALDPTNPMVNLSVALGYLHFALKRQADNRHYLVAQGFSFLMAYYEMRRKSEVAIERQEAEFNVGRAYQMLGLTQLAIPYYERSLGLARDVEGMESEGIKENFTWEAAFALQGLWATNGQPELARTVTENWLVL